MDRKKRRALESAGWRFGDYADFLGLTKEEQREVELRGKLSDEIRRRREAIGLTQKQLASKLKISQSDAANLELGVGVSLDLLFRALFTLDGKLTDLAQAKPRRRRQPVRS